MRIRHLMLTTTLATTVAGCGSALDVSPTTAVPNDRAIVDAVSARAALAGAYDALQSTGFYGEVLFTWGELSADNAAHTGTFTTYGDADQNVLTADNSTVEFTWDAIYDAINRANILIARVPSVTGLTDAQKNQMVGEAHFIRALSYHTLVKLWGGVPIRTTPVASISEAADVTRASVAEVYTQIVSDLSQAEALMTNNQQTRAGSRGAVRALRARVLLYRESPGVSGLNTGNWAAVETAATAVMSMSYSLAPSFTDLFTATGASTPEDIFRLRFTDQDPFWGGYYFLVRSLGGRYEVAPTTNLRNSYQAGDLRRDATIKNDPSRSPTQSPRYYGAKFPTSTGTEHPHVIRLAEIILIRAEARARQDNLLGAIADYNLLRERAGLAPHVLGVDVVSQADVLAAIARERRSELALEGDRWPDLVRTGQVISVMGLSTRPHQGIYPIPQNEIDVTGGSLQQTPGY